MPSVNRKVLDAVTATGASSALDTQGNAFVSMTVIASSVTTGATVEFQASPDSTNWATIGTDSVSTDGTTSTSVTEGHKLLRANITARTDGTYTVFITVSGSEIGNWLG